MTDRYTQERSGQTSRISKYEREKSKMFYNGEDKKSENKTNVPFVATLITCLKIV